MAESLSAPWLNLTAEEKRLFGHLFRQADSENLGVVTGEAAVKFFEKTKLEPQLLGEIWQIADKENRGLLTPSGFGMVLRLIGHYQAGRYPTPELALRPGPLPRFDNVNAPVISPIAKPLHSQSPKSLEPQASGSGPNRVPPLISEKATHYALLFEKSGARDGVLPGEMAKQIFERAGLTNEILGRIWGLADTEQKGALHVTEFVIAMHLITSFKTGQILSLPNILPYGLHEAASRLVTGRSTSGSATLSAVPRKPSDSGAVRGSTLPSSVLSTNLSSQSTGSSNYWLISPTDKLKYDLTFASLDKANRGYITGDEAVPFFCESKLPEDALAQIWDLADINSAGRLTRDEFAVAMYLIRQQKVNRNGNELIPSKLPANLVPPSMRNQARSTTSGITTDLSSSAVALPNSAVEDLFGLDALSSSITSPDQNIQEKVNSESFPPLHENNLRNKISNSPVMSSELLPNVAKPFIPSSSFGQSLSQQVTGSKNTAPHNSRNFSPQPSEDLLGDNDPEISKLLTNETAEIANLSSQVGSLAKQVQDIHNQKPITQNELSQSKSQKFQLEARLTQLKALHDHELKEFRALQVLQTSVRDENKTLQSEIENLGNKLQGLQGEHNQAIKAINKDQLENTNLKEGIRLINAQIAQLRTTLEKALLDARQQKGLVAINKKRLVTVEAERDKLQTEVELLNHKKENSDNSNSTSITRSPKPRTNSTPPISASTNPFFRQKGSSSENPFSNLSLASGSSEGTQQPVGFLQNVFGPSFGSSTSNELLESSMDQKSIRTSSLSSTKTSFVQVNSTDGIAFKPPLSFTPKLDEPQGLSEILGQSHGSSSQQQIGSDVKCSMHEDLKNNPSQLSASTTMLEEKPIANFNSNHQTDEVLSEIPDARQNSVQPILTEKTKNMPSSPSTPTEHQSSTMNMSMNEKNSFAKDDSTPLHPSAIQRVRTVKDDFDSAFAGLGTTIEMPRHTNTGGSSGSGSLGTKITTFDREFPPIAIQADSESDSSSEGIGFDDDFAAASPAFMKKSSHSSSDSPESQTSEIPIFSSASETQNTASINNSANLETLQPSDSTRSQEKSTSLSRISPRVVNSTSANAQSDLNVSKSDTHLVSSIKSSIDDEFDEFDEFYDLEDAKEGDANDEFVKISGNVQPDLAEFNPVSDKSLSVKDARTHQASISEEYVQSSDSNVQKVTSSSGKHDWDAIFSSLQVTESSTADKINTFTGNDNTQPSINNKFQSDEVLNDDISINRLTSMGYQRSDALAALEKFDYNLERAANFLASQS